MTKTDQFENIEKHKKRSNKLRPKRNTDGLEWRGLTRIVNDCKIFSFVTERHQRDDYKPRGKKNGGYEHRQKRQSGSIRFNSLTRMSDYHLTSLYILTKESNIKVIMQEMTTLSNIS